MKTIESITAVIATEASGDEGLPAMKLGNTWFPLVGADDKRTEVYYHTCKDLQVPYRIVRFTVQEDITAECETKYGAGSYVGMKIESAEERAEKLGVEHRRIFEDGEPRVITRDVKVGRLNFKIEKGIVTQCDFG